MGIEEKVTSRSEIFVTFRKIKAVLTPIELNCPALLTSSLLTRQVQYMFAPLQFALSFLSEFTKKGLKPANTLTVGRKYTVDYLTSFEIQFFSQGT